MNRQVAYLGPAGTYSHLTAIYLFGSAAERGFQFKCMQNGFRGILDAVVEGEVGWAVLPYINSTCGEIRSVFEILLADDASGIRQLEVVATYGVTITHSLIVHRSFNGHTRDLNKIFSKQEALQQCSGTLAELCPDAQLEAVGSTAAAMEKVSRASLEPHAVVGCADVLPFYPALRELQGSIQDNRLNITRFLVVRRKEAGALGPAASSEPREGVRSWIIAESSIEKPLVQQAMVAAERWGIRASVMPAIVTDPLTFRMRSILELDRSPYCLKVQYFLSDIEHLQLRLIASPISLPLDGEGQFQRYLDDLGYETLKGNPDGPAIARSIRHSLRDDPDDLVFATCERFKDCRFWGEIPHDPVVGMIDVFEKLGVDPRFMVKTICAKDEDGHVYLLCTQGGLRVDFAKASDFLGGRLRFMSDLTSLGMQKGEVTPVFPPAHAVVLLDTGIPPCGRFFLGSGDPSISYVFDIVDDRWPFSFQRADFVKEGFA